MSTVSRVLKHVMWSRWTTLLVAAALAAACVDEPVAPGPESEPPSRAPRVLGFVELTFSGIGTPEFSSNVLVAPTIAALDELRAERERSGDFREVITHDLTVPANSDDSGDGTIQLSRIASDELVHEGVRYMHATLAVRNAQRDGSPYDTERTNLTFLAVSTNNTLSETAVQRLLLGNGSPADPALALEVLPAGLPVLDADDNLTAAHPDVLQILTEAEVAAVDAPPAVANIFPYGFMVRSTFGPTSRTLPASPGPDAFDGEIDFGFRIPLQQDPADDPETLTVMMLAIDDSDTRITQSLLEQGLDDRNALRAYADELGPSAITLLPGGTLLGASGLRTICTVRTAGAAAAPSAYMVNADRTLDTFSPNPYATDGSGSFISATTAFEATFSTVADDIGPEHFAVRGQHSGPAFLGQAHSGNGTTTITTPSGSFYPGEEVEVTLNTRVLCPQPQVSRFRVAAAPATGSFQLDGTYDAEGTAYGVAIGDLNGNGSLDAVLGTRDSNDLSVLLNNGDGTFQAPQTYTVGTGPWSAVAIGDLNGDGSLDLAVGHRVSNDEVSVLLNNGDGTFQAPQAVGSSGNSVAIGDLNGNGTLDLAVASGPPSNNVTILLNNGDATFQAPQTHAVDATTLPNSVAIGDLNGNGSLDLAVAGSPVQILLNNGDGTFQAPQAVGSSGGSVAIGDLNGNGSLDLAVTRHDFGEDNVSVLLNNGDGTFQEQTYTAGALAWSAAIGDLNGDGSLDLAVGSEFGDLSVLLNNGDGTYQAQQTYAVDGQGRTVAIGDLNGDGILDLAVAAGNLSVLTGGQEP